MEKLFDKIERWCDDVSPYWGMTILIFAISFFAGTCACTGEETEQCEHIRYGRNAAFAEWEEALCDGDTLIIQQARKKYDSLIITYRECL